MNILNALQESGLTFDRFPDEILQLPYSIEQVTIQPNDTVTSDVINLKLKNLYENFLYIFSNTKISSNLIPISSTGILGCSGIYFSDFGWNKTLSSSQFFPVSSNEMGLILNNVKTICLLDNEAENAYSIVASDGQNVFLSRSTSDESQLLTTQRITAFNPEADNNVPFVDVVAITTGPNDSLLILDRGANTLYQYDAKGLDTDDNVFADKLIFRNVVGEFGSAEEKLSFNSPLDVVGFEGFIYVLDAGNYCIKKYDQYLNWQRTYNLSRDFYLQQPTKLKCDSYGNFYCMLSGNRFYKYSNDFQNKDLIEIDYLTNSEKAFDFVFSKTEKNIFYLITNQNVYKCMVNNLGNTIGKYLLYNFNYNDTQAISAFATVPYGLNDKNLVVSKNISGSQIAGAFIDNLNLYDNLTLPDFDVYSLNDILIKPEEYVQSWVINKSLAKLITNHIRLIEQLIGKFQFKVDDRGNSIFTFTRYLTQQEKKDLISEAESIL
jgi:hypothetical protein